jgi:hypothetical protein
MLRRTASCAGLVAGLAYASRAVASREGAGLAEGIVLLIYVMIYVTLAALIIFMSAGGIYGGYKARQNGESIPRGVGLGVLKGIGALVVVGLVIWVVLTIVAGLFWVYAMLTWPSQ